MILNVKIIFCCLFGLILFNFNIYGQYCNFDFAENIDNQEDAPLLKYRIPVVFHILYNKEQENLPDSVILNQLDILNSIYCNCRTDIRDVFKNVIACPKIKFYLAGIDPLGEATNGITRTKTSVRSFNYGEDLFLLDQPKFGAHGGLDAWPTNRYLNIWICNLDASTHNPTSLLGYAFPPLFSHNWDNNPLFDSRREGVVMNYKTIGSNNTYGNSDWSKVLAHEIGHYFGLNHLWGASENCESDDGLWDTPSTSKPSLDCNYKKNTCSDNSSDLPDMIENIMDYAPATCTGFFTKQQVSVILNNIFYNLGDLYTVSPSVDSSINRFELFPNPTSSNCYLYFQFFPKSIVKNPLSFEIYDSVGNLILSEDIQNQKTLINLETRHLRAGIYYVVVTSANCQIVRKRLILI